eukprot:scaffold81003_cov59-Attheya_sp.AAC.1
MSVTVVLWPGLPNVQIDDLDLLIDVFSSTRAVLVQCSVHIAVSSVRVVVWQEDPFPHSAVPKDLDSKRNQAWSLGAL